MMPIKSHPLAGVNNQRLNHQVSGMEQARAPSSSADKSTQTDTNYQLYTSNQIDASTQTDTSTHGASSHIDNSHRDIDSQREKDQPMTFASLPQTSIPKSGSHCFNTHCFNTYSLTRNVLMQGISQQIQNPSPIISRHVSSLRSATCHAFGHLGSGSLGDTHPSPLDGADFSSNAASGSDSPIRDNPHQKEFDIACDYFSKLNWSDEPQASQPAIDCQIAPIKGSNTFAIKMLVNIDTPIHSIIPELKVQMNNFGDWLPIIESMKISDEHTSVEDEIYTVAINTYGKFGISGRFALANTYLHQESEQLAGIVTLMRPDEDPIYADFENAKKPHLKAFISQLDFKAIDAQTTQMTYSSMSDPNIKIAPARMIKKNTLENNLAFVVACKAHLESQHANDTLDNTRA